MDSLRWSSTVARVVRGCALAALFVSGVSTASAGIVLSIVGDADALATGVLPGGTLPEGPFDHRSAAELLATAKEDSVLHAVVSRILSEQNYILKPRSRRGGGSGA